MNQVIEVTQAARNDAESLRGASGKSPLTALLLLAAILVTGLGFRVYHLGTESVDYEEYVNLGPLDAPNLFDYIAQVRSQDPSTAPLPFMLLYEWVKLVGNTVARARLLFVIQGLLAILMMYVFAVEFFGRNAYGRCAGLVAALCMAVSPVRIYFSQEARFYMPLTLLALMSFYFFLRATREDRLRRRGIIPRLPVWWALNVACNLLIPWTHLLGWVVLFTQGVALIALYPRRLRRSVAWAAVQFVGLVPWVIWVTTMPVQNFKGHYSFITPSDSWDVFGDLFGDDVLRMGAGLNPTRMWSFIPSDWSAALMNHHAVFDWPMILFGILSFAWLAWRLIRPHSENAIAIARKDYALLGIWFLLPVATLIGVSHLWIPCGFTRYSTYHTLALYFLMGGAVASLRPMWGRILATGFLLVLFLYQTSTFLPGPVRTDWRGLGDRIQKEGNPDDLILGLGGLYLPILLFNMDNPSHPAAVVQRHETLPDFVDFAFQQFAASPNPRDRRRTVWVYALLDQGTDTFERAVTARGYTVTRTNFRSGRQLNLYHVTRDTLPASVHSTPALNMDTFAKAIAARGQSSFVKAFSAAISYDSDETAAHFVRLGISLAEHGAWELAGAALRKAIVTNPAWAVQLGNLYDRVLVGTDGPDAYTKMKLLVDESGADPQLWAAYAQALLTAQKPDDALAAAQKSIQLDPENLLAYLLEWRARVGRKDHGAAAAALEEACRKDAGLAATVMPLCDAFRQNDDTNGLRALAGKFSAAGVTACPELFMNN